jgi:HamA
VMNSLEGLLEAQHSHYDANFSHVEHEITCDEPPNATIRLHFVKSDASGEPRFQELARLLARYITLYCFKAERRKDLLELERNEMFMQARDLFRSSENSGQAGELLVYFLLETVLNAPQALKKMLMTTNPREERKGSDGVHLRWIEEAGILEIIFAESKIWKSFPSALADAFASMEKFHDSRTRQHEINAFTSGFSNLDQQLQEKIVSYVEGENASNCRMAQACLIGFNWDEYECLTDGRRADFIKEFDDRYRIWATGIRDSLNAKLRAFKHKNLRFEFFMLPFKDVEAFRIWFREALGG